MCGLAGFVGAGDRDDIEAMTRAMRHRGPDAEGFHVDRDRAAYLGHRRLAIRDVSGGDQPMANADGSIQVVYNGEIYNYPELRAELEAAGHVFRTSHSDTEILVHGYAAWGEGLAARLNGMFAFAILDKRRERLYLARDRFGEKPLYYSRKRGLFAFASELEALVRHRGLDRSISRVALHKFFGYGYIPAPHALYADAAKLPGGHHLVFDLQTREISVTRYWRFELEPDAGLAERGADALADELRALLSAAVGRRLVSDVPLGVFLSGGLDSSTVLAMAAGQSPAGSVSTFTIGFTEPSYDESGYARQVSAHVGSRHNEKILDMAAAEALIPDVLDRMDEPLGDASLLPTHLLSAFAREHVTVALSGDGGDELFGGYDPFKALRPAAAYAALVPNALHGVLRAAAERLPRSTANMSLDFKLRRALMGVSQPEPMWAPAWMAPVDPGRMGDLFDDAPRPEDLYDEAMELWETGPATSRVDRLLQFFTCIYLQDDILTKVDRASMMSSLETRAVFLDNEVVDFCRRLPERFKFDGSNGKILLKKAMEPLLPRDIVHRRKKGFGIPLADWMRHVPSEPPLAPVAGVRMEWAERAWREHRTGAADHRLFLWSWLSLQHVLGRGRPATQDAAGGAAAMAVGA